MKTQPIAPTGQSQSFDVTETFFSTTDARGVITAGNEVFCRTSGYTLSEMVGKPHNIIRHPHMPRQVFRQLWETIRAGRSFMGYVKNQAKNGNHYWVFAVVVPVPRGYLSVRIKPTTPTLAQIDALYQQLATREADAIAAGTSESRAADVSRDLLAAAVRELGFASYDAFSHHALNEEIKRRDRELASRSLRMFPATLPTTGDEAHDGQLAGLFRHALAAYEGVNGLFASLDAFTEISRDIRTRQTAVERIAEDFRLNALNAHIAAHPLGAEGATLGTVAQILNGHGASLSRNVGVLATSIIGTTAAVADIASNLCAARIQIEMLLSFIGEIAAARHDAAGRHHVLAMAADLQAGFASSVQQAFSALQTVERQLPQVVGTKEQLRKDIVYLQVAQISGLVEVSRIDDGGGLFATFDGLRKQIEQGKQELEALDRVVDQLKTLIDATPPLILTITRAMQAMREGELAGGGPAGTRDSGTGGMPAAIQARERSDSGAAGEGRVLSRSSTDVSTPDLVGG